MKRSCMYTDGRMWIALRSFRTIHFNFHNQIASQITAQLSPQNWVEPDPAQINFLKLWSCLESKLQHANHAQVVRITTTFYK